jgi:hypothetical protein
VTILLFVYFGTHDNKIHTIYYETSVFVLIYSMLLFCFYWQSSNNKNGLSELSIKTTLSNYGTKKCLLLPTYRKKTYSRAPKMCKGASKEVT